MPGIGDMLWFLPHARAIADHFTEENAITLLARPSTHAANLLSEESSIKEILLLYRCQMNRQGKERDANHRELHRHDGISGCLRLACELKAHKFNAAWILDRRSYYVYTAMLAGIPNRFGLGFGWEKLLLKAPTLAKQYHKMHARDRVTHWLTDLGINIQDYEYPLKIAPKATKKVHAHFKKDRPWVCFGLGASEIEKKWSSSAFSSLAQSLTQKGMTVFLCGGPGEKEEALAIKSQAPKAHCITDWSIMETSALMTESDLYVGNDTFLYNLAALQGKKACAIAGVVPTHTYLKTMSSVYAGGDIHKVTSEMVLENLKQEAFF